MENQEQEQKPQTVIDQYANVKKYKTSDIALAATMILKQEKLIYVEPINRKPGLRSDIFHFVFLDTPGREDIVIKFSANHEDSRVLPNPFRSTMRYLKELTKNYGK